MKIATLLFAYNRSYHTKQVLDALSLNTVLPTKLFIFHDGLKNEKHRKEHEKTAQIINDVDFCPVEIYSSKENKGLANSIIDGVTAVLKEYDAVIVLEDDCVPAPLLMHYMVECLTKYADDKRIGSISGYSWPQENNIKRSDIYFSGRFCSWGWATWKDRWAHYERDAGILDELYSNVESSMNLARWGKDLSVMLRDWKNGLNDSWAVFFTLILIKQQWYTVTPVNSLIKNIGFDGTGVHCGVNNIFDIEFVASKNRNMLLPSFDENLIRNVACFNGIIEHNNKPATVIYGMGDYFSYNVEKIATKYNVIALMDRERCGYYSGIKIISPKDLAAYQYEYIVIMIKNREICEEIIDFLVGSYGVNKCKIKYGIDEL